MNDSGISLEVLLREGPVAIPSLAGSGVEATHALWNGIAASEFFPPKTESAFYLLSLRKQVEHPDEVSRIEDDLVFALQLLSMAWVFAGGSFMVLETREVVSSARFESNASTVRTKLLRQAAPTPIEAHSTVAYETLATYRGAPLKPASTIIRAAITDHGVRNLLRYHQTAWVEYYHRKRTDRSSWFIDLYKVRELLKMIYGNEQATRSTLGISKSDWSFFGRMLNQSDVRHAEVTCLAPSVSRADIDRLYDLARTWAGAHLTALGLPVL